MGYYAKKKYFGFGQNSCITSKNDKTKKLAPPEPQKMGGVFILGVVLPCKGCAKRRGDPSLN